MTLNELPTGHQARFRQHQLPLELARRLAAFGLRPNSLIEVINRGWLGGPLQLRIGSTEFMLRREHCSHIEVQPE